MQSLVGSWHQRGSSISEKANEQCSKMAFLWQGNPKVTNGGLTWGVYLGIPVLTGHLCPLFNGS